MTAIQVCFDRDVECGDFPRNWCESCPKRAASPVQGAASDDRQHMSHDAMQALCAANPVAASGLPLAAASATDQGAAVAYFRKASSFGPWIECKPGDDGATRFAALAERAQAAQPSGAVEIPPVICVGRRFLSTNEATVFFERDVSDDELLALNARLGAKLNNPAATPAPEQEAAPSGFSMTAEQVEAKWGEEWAKHGLPSQYAVAFLRLAQALVRAAPVEQEASQPQAKKLAHGHREDYFLMANARRVAMKPIWKIQSMPNWELASEIFATGSNSARLICYDAGLDPDGYRVIRATATNTNPGDPA